jgi:glutathione S-transferase
VESYLKMRGNDNVPHVIIGTHDTSESDTERLPFIEYQGRQITDSRFIIDFLEKEFPNNNSNAPLTRAQEVQLQLLLNTCETLKFAHYRASIVDFPEYSVELFAQVLQQKSGLAKFLLRRALMHFIRPDLIDWLNKCGFGDLTDEQYRQNFERDLQCLDFVLTKNVSEETPFILGTERMTKADCLIAPYIRSAVRTASRSPELCKLVPAYAFAASRSSFERYLKKVDAECG